MTVKVQKSYKSLCMPNTYRTRSPLEGESLVEAQGALISSGIFFCLLETKAVFPVSILIFSYGLDRFFLPIVRNTWSGLHHQNVLCDLRALDEAVDFWVVLHLQTPWSSSRMKSWELNEHQIYDCVD